MEEIENDLIEAIKSFEGKNDVLIPAINEGRASYKELLSRAANVSLTTMSTGVAFERIIDLHLRAILAIGTDKYPPEEIIYYRQIGMELGLALAAFSTLLNLSARNYILTPT